MEKTRVVKCRKCSEDMIFRVSVDHGAGEVAILYRGEQVLMWETNEWTDDPEVGLVVAEAIRQAYEEPDQLYAFLHSKGKLPGQDKF